MLFSHILLLWYSKNKRTLPWRHTRDPYKIWLSEVMLQQTRVAQGTPYYLKFVDNFPKVEDLAKASEEQVLKLWQGLGYYSRARNLHATAKLIATDLNGRFPSSYIELLKLKGIGDYTASAISSICFDEPQPAVDGNVYRVLARYFNVDLPINSSEGIKYFRKLAQEVMDPGNIRDYNQAIMEFGSIQCTPKNPDCSQCPLKNGCAALQLNKVNELPKKINRTKIKNRHFNYLVPISVGMDFKRRTLLQQRKGKGIWQNLWEFPLLETNREINLKEVKERSVVLLNAQNVLQVHSFNKEPIVHKLSHQHLYAKFWIIETTDELKGSIELSDLGQYPVPVLIADFINTFKNSYF